METCELGLAVFDLRMQIGLELANLL